MIRPRISGSSWTSTRQCRPARLAVRRYRPIQTADVPLSFWLDSTEEYGVTIAASLARHFLNQNRNVGLIVERGADNSHTGRSRRSSNVEDSRATGLAQSTGDMPLAELLLAEGGLFTRNSTVIAITPSTDEAWVQALINIVTRNVQSVAVVIEPNTFGGQNSSLMVVSTSLRSAFQPIS